MSNLQAMVEAAKEAEIEVNQMVSISMGSSFKRNPIGGNAAGGGRAFLAHAMTNSSSESASPQCAACVAR